MRVISGDLKGRSILGFNMDGTRPTMDRVKESIFSSIQLLVPNSICLDLFAGSGSLGIEAISNGAKICYFVDKSDKAFNILKTNMNNFKIDNSVILKMDYKSALNNFKNDNLVFDIIFLDPPYNMHIINDIIDYIAKNNLLSNDGVIICEVDENYLNVQIDNLIQYKNKRYGSTYVYYYKHSN